jgi:hypothetical protein
MYFLETIGIEKCTDFKKSAFLRCLDDLQFKCMFHKQSGSGIRVKAESEKINISDPQHCSACWGWYAAGWASFYRHVRPD